ncbi:protein kinase domain-containing protein [Embleya sp. MST-111070]|uniref:serine/threonine-protein kinase n=1 Tax=Embleya sp. MST-111070 TaxID=3398231 RepID=UPI003F737291
MWGRGTVLGDRYTLAKRLGGGAMGEVWRADDGVLERPVAVKILLPALLDDAKFAERFRREAKVLAALDHPGIVDVHDYGESGSEPRVAYIVMELVDGLPLDALLAAGAATMPADRALGIVAQALDALHAAHRRDIVHRDVKPSNLMIGADDRVTVTDFGIAHSTTAGTRLTASHSVLGTARYIAPEQARGLGAVPASDQYAIGVVCYELLTGEPLFTGDAVFEVVLRHIREPAPELPAEFPEPVRAFVARALAKEPEDRFPDAAHMATAAREAMASTSTSAPAAALTTDDTPGAADEPPASLPASAEGAPVPSPGPAAEKPDPAPAAAAAAAAAEKPTTPATPAADDAVPTPAGSPAPLQAPAPAEAEADRPDTPPPSATPRPWKRHGLAAVLLVLGVIAGVVATVLYINPLQAEANRAPNAAGAKTPPAEPRLPEGTSADPATGPATPSGPTTGTPSNNPTGNQPPSGPPAAGTGGGNPNTSTSTGAGGSPGGGEGGSTGTGTGTKPKPTAPAPPPAQSAPQGCGGANWGAITSVADGLQVGLAADGPTAGKEVIMGGHTRYGWVRSTSTWDSFNTCSLEGPALGQPYGNVDRAELAIGFGYSTNWRLVTAPTSGAVYIKDFGGQTCLTNNGNGKPLSVVTCTPANRSQQWRVP